MGPAGAYLQIKEKWLFLPLRAQYQLVMDSAVQPSIWLINSMHIPKQKRLILMTEDIYLTEAWKQTQEGCNNP